MQGRHVRLHRNFILIITAIALVLGAEVTVWKRMHDHATTAHRRLLELRRDEQALKKSKPSLAPETMRAMQEDLAAAEQETAQRELEFTRVGPDVRGSAGTRADMFFELVQFVERMREAAKVAGVKIAPTERFGFAEYVHAGPEPSEVAGVMRDRFAAEFLLHVLFESRPLQLLGLDRGIAADAKPGATASDRFEWPDPLSLRRKGVTDSQALRVSFVGETVSLRELLNALAEAPGMMLVRSVEVAPATEQFDGAARETSVSESASAWVPRSLSKFTVVVEFVESVPAEMMKESR
jgi:hypothetical protein